MRSISEIIEILKDKAEVNNMGKAGTETVVDKEVLKEASVYLEDYLYIQGKA